MEYNIFGGIKKTKLTPAEKKTLMGLIEFPEASDTLIAEKIGISRNTLANSRRKFLKNNICSRRVVPDLHKLGLKILVLTYCKFDAKITPNQREEVSNIIRKCLAPHFYFTKSLDCFYISAHLSKKDHTFSMAEVMDYYVKHELLLEEPISYQLSIPKMAIIKDFNFSPMINKLFNLNNKNNKYE